MQANRALRIQAVIMDSILIGFVTRFFNACVTSLPNRQSWKSLARHLEPMEVKYNRTIRSQFRFGVYKLVSIHKVRLKFLQVKSR